MALVNVESKLVDGRYQSNPVTVTGQSLAIQIDFENRSDVMVEMSVDGVSYASSSFIQNRNSNTEVAVVSGAVPGMFIRLQFYGQGKPSKISVIQNN